MTPNPTAETLLVVGVRFAGARPTGAAWRDLDAFAAADVYAAAGLPFAYVEPTLPELPHDASEAARVGAIGGEIARAVAEARRAGQAVLLVGGNCHHATGVVGGLQAAHGADLRLGLVWFDAHGDFNTPRTTISGSLGGMPVAVCAGLALPEWREASGILAPLPTDRIVMTDLRDLDPAESELIRAVGVAVHPVGGQGSSFGRAVADLAARVDLIYLHVDADILDASLTPGHRTKAPGGPDLAETLAAVGAVLATGKVAALGLVSVYTSEPSDADAESGVALLRGALAAWRRGGVLGECEVSR